MSLESALVTDEVIYFDNNATTRIAPEVFEAMVPFLTEQYGNPSSLYRFGSRVAKSVEAARAQVAALLGCEPAEIIFTSCGTESDNAAIEAALKTTRKKHIVTSQVEHSALIKQCASLESRGHAVTYVAPDAEGIIKVEDVEKAIRSDTAIVSIMWANNETGVLSPIAEIADLCKRKGVLFHTDAVQVPGKIPISLKDANIQFLSISGHKLHAPKGVGALYIRGGTKFVPYVIGGGQEKKRRGGTENVASIVALGRAAQLALEHLPTEQTEGRALRDKLEQGILSTVPDATRCGHATLRLPNTSNICFAGIEAEALLLRLDQHNICCSSGSACTTGSPEPSHVLKAMGISNELARGAIRFSLGRYNTEAEVDKLLSVLPDIIAELRALSPSAAAAVA